MPNFLLVSKVKHMKLNTSHIKKTIPILHQLSDIERSALFEKDVPFVFKGYSFFFQYELKQINVFLEKKGFKSLDHHLHLSSLSFNKYPLSYQEIDLILKGVKDDLIKNTRICTAVWMSFWVERGEQHFFDLQTELKGLWQRIFIQTLLETDIYHKNHPLHHSILAYFDFLDQQYDEGFLFASVGFWRGFKKNKIMKKLRKDFTDYQLISKKSFKALHSLSDILLQEPIKGLEHLLFLIYFCVKQNTFWSYQFFIHQQEKVHEIKEALSEVVNQIPNTLVNAVSDIFKIPSLKTMLVETQEHKLDLCIFPELLDLSQSEILESMLFLKHQKADLSQELVVSYMEMLIAIIRRGRVVEHLDEEGLIQPPKKQLDALLWVNLSPKMYQVQLHPGVLHIPSEHTKKR